MQNHFFTGKTSQQCLSTWVVILWMGQRNPNPPVEDGGKHSKHPMILFGFQPIPLVVYRMSLAHPPEGAIGAAEARPSAWFCCSRSASSGSRGCSQESTSGTSSARCRQRNFGGGLGKRKRKNRFGVLLPRMVIESQAW